MLFYFLTCFGLLVCFVFFTVTIKIRATLPRDWLEKCLQLVTVNLFLFFCLLWWWLFSVFFFCLFYLSFCCILICFCFVLLLLLLGTFDFFCSFFSLFVFSSWFVSYGFWDRSRARVVFVYFTIDVQYENIKYYVEPLND